MELIIYHNATIISMDKERRIWDKGALVIEGNKIKDIGATNDILAKYPNSTKVDVQGNILLPGLINTHVHLAQAMIRGAADDLPLMPWLQERIWPFQANYNPEDAQVSAELGIAEMLLSGTTTFLESMLTKNYGLDGIAEKAGQSGIRAVLSKIVMEPLPGSLLHPGLTEDKESSFQEAKAAYQKWNGSYDNRLQIWLAPRWTGLFNPSLLQEVSKTMQEMQMKATMHFAESTEDIEAISQGTGKSPIEFLIDMGVANPDMVLIHCTYLDEKDIKLLGHTGAHVAHCPLSNMKTAMGYCQVPAMQEAGVNITLGTDGAPCNNNYDMFLDMRGAALLHKYATTDSTTMPAEKVLEIATINGAKALGLEEEIGSLEVGKKADFIIVDTAKPALQPSPNPVSTIVYAATGRDVQTVVINGKTIVENYKLLTIDVENLLEKTKATAEKIMGLAKINKDKLVSWPIIK